MEIPLSTQYVGDSWKDMTGEFSIYANADGNTVITNGNTKDPITLEIPKDSIAIAAIDVYFGIPETYEKMSQPSNTRQHTSWQTENCSVKDTSFITNGQWPDAAKEIMEEAGLTFEYAYLLNNLK